MRAEDFGVAFRVLTGNGPFPWQQALFDELAQGRYPKGCDLPTGLGKTSVIAIWLLALAHRSHLNTVAGYPRRLVYVVNRRTVVDQATREAEKMRDALRKPELGEVTTALRAMCIRSSDVPIAISTLRGEFADNAEWRIDPARAAVIVGTVDMIGSRLLFAGYGRGFKSRPLHAGFLGQDTLLVHDEAHLEPAFQVLIATIEAEQERCREFRSFRVMALTATPRGEADGRCGLTVADRKHKEVWKRITAAKWMLFHPQADDEKMIADHVTRLALEYKGSGQAIIIFLRKLEDVHRVAGNLGKAALPVQILTGTLRGLERDLLATVDPIFARFMPNPEATPEQGTVFLVCTSAGEVGVNISADHLICDLTPFDSMAQRFGRVNRFGHGAAQIDVVYCAPKKAKNATEVTAPPSDSARPESGPSHATDPVGDRESDRKAKAQSPVDRARERTFCLLQRLPKRDDQRHDASPTSLEDLLSRLPLADRDAVFTPPPAILPATDVLFDAWALTSVRQKLPGRPPVVDWLHGVADWEPPETHVAWREEVECLTGDLLETCKAEDLLEDYPLKPHELLRDQMSRVFNHLETIAARAPQAPAWLIESDGSIRVLSLAQLVEKNKQKPVINLSYCTVLLPPSVGGLEKGMLDGGSTFGEAHHQRYDVSEEWRDHTHVPRRCRVWDDGQPSKAMRLIRTIDTRPDAEDASDEDEHASRRRYWRWYVTPRSADDDGSQTAHQAQDLTPHLKSAERYASALVAKLGLSKLEASAVTLAAKWHDLGKDRASWQRSIGNRDYPKQVLAKSDSTMRPVDISAYRHEFGSLLDVSGLPEFHHLAHEIQQLVMHLIAAHHGRARPHFPAVETFDPKHTEEAAEVVTCEVPRRFARLQRTYGRWGLAYLESLVRAVDALASQPVEAGESETDEAAGASVREAGG